MAFAVIPLLVALVVVSGYLVTHREPSRRARFLRRAAFTFTVTVTLLFAAFVAGETIDDPGGLAAAGWIASWLVPLTALVVLAWRRPRLTLLISVGLTVVLLGLTVWAAARPAAWQSLENGHGPVRTVALFVLTAAVGVCGVHAPLPAGWLLVTLGTAPILLSSFERHPGSATLAAIPALIVGALYLLAGYVDHGHEPRRPTRGHNRLAVR
jgi:hypothetical protein